MCQRLYCLFSFSNQHLTDGTLLIFNVHVHIDQLVALYMYMYDLHHTKVIEHKIDEFSKINYEVWFLVQSKKLYIIKKKQLTVTCILQNFHYS